MSAEVSPPVIEDIPTFLAELQAFRVAQRNRCIEEAVRGIAHDRQWLAGDGADAPRQLRLLYLRGLRRQQRTLARIANELIEEAMNDKRGHA